MECGALEVPCRANGGATLATEDELQRKAKRLKSAKMYSDRRSMKRKGKKGRCSKGVARRAVIQK